MTGSELQKLKEKLVCLVPLDGKPGMTCHEKSVCDCTVLSLLTRLEEQDKVIESARGCIRFYGDEFNYIGKEMVTATSSNVLKEWGRQARNWLKENP